VPVHIALFSFSVPRTIPMHCLTSINDYIDILRTRHKGKGNRDTRGCNKKKRMSRCTIIDMSILAVLNSKSRV